jgi:hypothetical protein
MLIFFSRLYKFGSCFVVLDETSLKDKQINSSPTTIERLIRYFLTYKVNFYLQNSVYIVLFPLRTQNISKKSLKADSFCGECLSLSVYVLDSADDNGLDRAGKIIARRVHKSSAPNGWRALIYNCLYSLHFNGGHDQYLEHWETPDQTFLPTNSA